jgi:DNA repair protein SbcC/Rad50
MTLSIDQLRERVGQHFSDVEQIDESIIRCTRSLGRRDFAVYYVDIAQRLPESPESLTTYQDRVIGAHYFEGKRSLQWNYYLYFVRSKDQLATGEARLQKELIERDRTYARKFVIAEEELDSALTPPPVTPVGAAPRTSVLSLWIERLAEKGLDRVILSNDDLPTRLELIESSPAIKSAVSKASGKNIEVDAAQGLRTLELKKYRRYPMRRRFDFGRVNLIFGANGTGKTSLLEAIELFYCGRNARNPDLTSDYDLVAVLQNGNREMVNNNRSLQMFRNRNLSWYGQPEIKTNNLYQSFAQFNFLDTDAAASLADSTSRIEEDLSKLLVGPDASKTWTAIERVSEAVSSQLRGLNTRWTEATEELAVLSKQIGDATSREKQSDSLYVRLSEMIDRIQWHLPQESKEAQARRLVEALSELLSIAHQAVGLGWIQRPSSLEAIRTYCSDTKKNIAKAEGGLSNLDIGEMNQKRQGNEVRKQQEAIGLIREIRTLSDAGVWQRVRERASLQSSAATYSSWLAGTDIGALRMLLASFPEVSVAGCHSDAAEKRTAAQTMLSRAKDEYADYSKLRDQSLKLTQQLRQVAERILQGSTKPDECPLCHTQFAPGDLAKHIEAGLDESIERRGQEILGEIQKQERAVAEASDIEAGAVLLTNFCDRADLSTDMAVGAVVARLEEVRKNAGDIQSRLALLDAELRSLESRGLSMDRFEEIQRRLRELGLTVNAVSPEALERLSETVTERLKHAMETLEAESENVSGLRQSLESILGAHFSKPTDFRVAFSQLKENLAITESVQTRLMQLTAHFPWPESRSLAELTVTADAIRNVATELQAALGNEKQAEANYTDWSSRVERLKNRVAELRERIQRLTNAKSTLEELQNNHSLKKAMEDALRRNRTIIEEIFARIHSPAEFTGLGFDWATLRRKIDGSEAKLSEISTGQRAAFALSIFLAQNAQLTVGPPIILIDDPIAHVDDLNALSFLDYLREVSLSEKRQIFFATANDKLATLFERKFDFLGEGEFHRFDLLRDE